MPELTGDPKSHPTSEFRDGMTGQCLCGSITVKINDKELFTKPRTLLCHCQNCRKVAGSVVATNLVLDEGQVEIEDKGKSMKTYEDYNTGSGKAVYRSFCSTCGNPISSVADMYPGRIILKLGIFPRIPTPMAEGFGAHKQEWEVSEVDWPVFKIAPGGEKLKD